MSTSRREFLGSVAAVGALAALGTRVRAQAAAKPAATKALPFTISLAEWSYHEALHKGELDHRDFTKVAKETHKIDAAEFVNTFFKDKARDAEYVKDLRKRADDLGVAILLVMCDAEGDLGSAEKAKRAEAVENHKKWLDAAHVLGCHSIRVNVYGTGTPEEHMAQAAESLHALALIADPMNLNVIVENHGGITSDGSWMAGVMKKAAHPRVGTLPDFGNFKMDDGKEYDRYKGVAEMMPWAKGVSAKCYDFDDKGEETTIDFHKMMKIVVDAGYHGHLGIEYEGPRMSEHDGVEAMKRLLERVRGALS
jgi:sugar phosphate isomerase/epimerase